MKRNFKLNILQAMQSLNYAKRKSVLALIGIVVGIAAVMAIMNINKIVSLETQKSFDNLGIDIVYVSVDQSKVEKGRGAFEAQDMLGLAAVVPAVIRTEPSRSLWKTVVFQGRYYKVPVVFTTINFAKMNPARLAQGRFLAKMDDYEPVCILGADLAQKLQQENFTDLLHKKIIINNMAFSIVGVLEKFPVGGFRPGGVNGGVLVPFVLANHLFKVSCSAFYAQIKPGADYNQAVKEIEQYFRLLPKSLNVKVKSLEESLAQKRRQMRFLALLLGSIGSIALILGGVGIMNFLLVSVEERTREIGIRRAVGARKKDIQEQFLAEAIILCCIGGILGIGLGISVTFVLAYFAKWEFVFSYAAVILGGGVACLTGVFFGFYPAYRAAGLKPIAALRHE
ncbi:FtsX-like permease family protein [bacterium]|nr:FtsX-like permease family protein [bacterium]MBT7088349.1 FtsX-like permease family protein [bacterium]